MVAETVAESRGFGAEWHSHSGLGLQDDGVTLTDSHSGMADANEPARREDLRRSLAELGCLDRADHEECRKFVRGFSSASTAREVAVLVRSIGFFETWVPEYAKTIKVCFDAREEYARAVTSSAVGSHEHMFACILGKLSDKDVIVAAQDQCLRHMIAAAGKGAIPRIGRAIAAMPVDVKIRFHALAGSC